MDKVVLEYEQCSCSKISMEVTITSMIIEKSDQTAAKRIIEKQAFDCNQKIACGVFSILGKDSRVDWSECTHPKLAEI